MNDALTPPDNLTTGLLNLLSALSDIESFLGLPVSEGVCGPEKVKPSLLDAKLELVRTLSGQAERIRKELIGKL